MKRKYTLTQHTLNIFKGRNYHYPCINCGHQFTLGETITSIPTHPGTKHYCQTCAEKLNIEPLKPQPRLQYPKYYFNLCLYTTFCSDKHQDKKTKLPLCITNDQCNQQFRVSQQYLNQTKLTIQQFRKIRFKLEKNECQPA